MNVDSTVYNQMGDTNKVPMVIILK